MRTLKYRHEFAEFIPERLEEGVVYVSMTYATAAHLCFCGCGEKVVTPITPTDWQLKFDGDSISLDPSVGSWSLACRSHYWLEYGTVVWAAQWTQRMISRERERDRRKKESFYSRDNSRGSNVVTANRATGSLWRRVVRSLLGESEGAAEAERERQVREVQEKRERDIEKRWGKIRP